jgi:hypothetical protein
MLETFDGTDDLRGRTLRLCPSCADQYASTTEPPFTSRVVSVRDVGPIAVKPARIIRDV